ncbi:MAG: alpha-L-fucosidase [Kiritimatiellae bacterium]|nr:alpha-L-fucosidase [Kiritimatiellia bacterium]
MIKQFRVLIAVSALIALPIIVSAAYKADWTSLDSRPVPTWWSDAKFGIFIHWGIYAVPSYAPTDSEAGHGSVCYSEWYHGRLLLKEKSFLDHHEKVYGNAPYANFASQFRAENFKPAVWAKIFRKSGAKYVVLTSKHHDGYALWPSSRTPYFNSVAIGPGRDICGELGDAVRAEGLRYGFYYSLYEYANPLCTTNFLNRRDVTPLSGKDWAAHMNIPQLKELAERYRADIIWPDGEWDFTDKELRSEEFLAWLYNESPVRDNVVVNDRWGKGCRGRHGGHFTTEYGSVDGNGEAGEIHHPWEECRGIGRSFGYNRFETAADYMSTEDILELLSKTVSGGGNLLLDIGPTADGRIPPIMESRLLEVGAWLETFGAAIYGADRARTASAKASRVFLTQKGSVVYVMDFDDGKAPVRIDGVGAVKSVERMDGGNVKVGWRQDGSSVEIEACPCEDAIASVYRLVLSVNR